MNTEELGRSWAEALWDWTEGTDFPGDEKQAEEVILVQGPHFGVTDYAFNPFTIVEAVLSAAKTRWEEIKENHA